MKKMYSFVVAIAMSVSMLSSMVSIEVSAKDYVSFFYNGSTSSSSGSSKTSGSKTTKASSTKVSKSVNDIKSVCGLKSGVETSVAKCYVDVDSKVNPYDVVYDYGTAYDAYVKACDWSLVFDADYYIEQFPMLAILYHNDKALLLKHFQTVGIHEGRQGNSKFNVGVYKANCSKSVSKAFGNNYEGYYFYYMLNYSSEKSIKATSKNSKLQQKIVMTAQQAQEFADINAYRAEVDVKALKFDSELAAYANYRGWINAHDGYGCDHGHDWVMSDVGESFVYKYVWPEFNLSELGENVCTWNHARNSGEVHSTCYRNSPAHYNALISAGYDIYAASNSYQSKANSLTAQFDIFGNVK